MYCHLVAVEVSVEARAYERVKPHGLALDEDRLERLDSEAVKGRSAVQKNRVLTNHAVEDIPYCGLLALDHLLRSLDGGCVAHGLKLAVNERLEELESHLLRQAALIEPEVRTAGDYRASGVVNTLSEKVLAEASLLSLDHVGKGLQRPLVGAGDGAAAAAVVEEGVNGLLQHALLVADNDVRSGKFVEPAQTVVSVDDAAVEIIEIRSREASAVKRNQRTEIRRKNRKNGKDHPLRLVA